MKCTKAAVETGVGWGVGQEHGSWCCSAPNIVSWTARIDLIFSMALFVDQSHQKGQGPLVYLIVNRLYDPLCALCAGGSNPVPIQHWARDVMETLTVEKNLDDPGKLHNTLTKQNMFLGPLLVLSDFSAHVLGQNCPVFCWSHPETERLVLKSFCSAIATQS